MPLGLGTHIDSLSKITPLPWSPKDQGLVGRLAFWLENNKNVSVSAWLGSHGEADPVQTNSSYQPSLSDPLGGLVFNGTSDYMDFTTTYNLEEDTAFSIGAAVNLAGLTNEVLLSDSSSEFIEFMTAKKFRFKGSQGGALTTVIASEGAIFTTGSNIAILFERSRTGETALYVNGVLINPQVGSQNTTNTRGWDIANLGIRNDTDRHFNGTVLEIFVHTTKLSDSQRNNAINYLMDKFNI